MAAPTVRSSSAASNTGGSLLVAKPAGLATGDLMVAWHYADNDGVLASMGGPSGWALLDSDPGVSGGHPYVKVWTKVAAAADASASGFTFTNSTAGIFNSVAILAFTAGTFNAASPTSAVEFQNGGTASSTEHTAPSITGVVDGLLCTSHGTDSGGTAATYSPPSGMTEWADTNSGTGSYTALSVAALALSSTATTGAKTATCSTSRPWKGSALIINPAAGGGGGGGGTGGARTNLVPNPALKVDATGWSAVDATTGAALGGWGRSTSVGAGLPRTTGFEGTTAPLDVVSPRAQVTAGQQYYWAVWVHALADLSANMLVNYYTAASGGTFVSNSGATVPLTLATGATARFVLGPYTVPSTAVSGYLKLNDVNGLCEITGYQVESAATFGAYFDGDSTGASWNGTAGNSTSSLLQVGTGTQGGTDPIHIGESFTKTVTAIGPPPVFDAVGVAATFTVAAGTPSSGLFESARVRDGFLISSLEWDPDKGRNRVSAFTFDGLVTKARVSRRRVRGGAWELVRGGAVDVVAGRMLRPVDDYEFPSGVDLDYRIEGVTAAGTVAQTATVRRQSDADAVWLKFIASPALNRRLEFMGRSEVTRPSRTALYDVQGRPDPVVVSDVHSSRRMTIKCKTETSEDTAALDHALAQGLPCYLQVPETLNTPSMYAVVGDYQFEPPALKSSRNVWSIPLVEVAAPPPSIVSPGATWAQLLIDYPTWEDVMAGVPTWLETAD